MLPFATQYLQKNHKGKVTVLSQFCPICLEASEHYTSIPDWTTFFQRTNVLPEQALNAFNPSEGTLKDLYDLNTPKEPCQECVLKCRVCQGPITKGQSVETTERWPSLQVHRACAARCDQAGCPAFVDTIPRYIPFSIKPLCTRHAARAAPVQKPAPIPRPEVIPKPEVIPRQEAKKPEKKGPPRPTAASQKLVRINKECKTPSMASFLGTKKPKPSQAPQDELVYRRDTGEPWAYRRDGVLYRISNDEPVERREDPPLKRKYDFSAPPAEREHEGQAGGDDPEEGAGEPGAVVEGPVPDVERQ